MYNYTIQCYSDDGIFMKNNKSIAIIPNQSFQLNENNYVLGSKVSFLRYKKNQNEEIDDLYFRKSNFEVFKLDFQHDVLCVCHPKHLTDIRIEEFNHLSTNPSRIIISDVDTRGNLIEYNPLKYKRATLAVLTKQYIYIYNCWTVKSLKSYLISKGFISIIETTYANNHFLLGYHPSGYVALTNELAKRHSSFLCLKSTPQRIRDSFSDIFNFGNHHKKTKLFNNEFVGLQEPKYGWVFFHPAKHITSVYRKRFCDNIPLSKTHYVIIADNREYISTIRDKKEMEFQLIRLNIQFEFKRSPSKEIYTLKQL